MSNTEILDKLDAAMKQLTVSDLSSGGLLQPTYFDRFVRKMQDASVVLAQTRRQDMETQTVHIDLTGFSGRVITSAIDKDGEAKERSAGETMVKPTKSQNKLEAVEMRGKTGIDDRALRRNIERGGLETTLVDLFGDAAGRDMEEAALLADTDLDDTVHDDVRHLAAMDGWLKKAGNKVYGTHEDASGDAEYTDTLQSDASAGQGFIIVDDSESGTDDVEVGDHLRIGSGDLMEYRTVTGVTDSTNDTLELDQPLRYGWPSGADVVRIEEIPDFSADPEKWPENLFEAALDATPKKYLVTPDSWRFWVSWEIENAYRNLLAKRGTAMADTFIKGRPVPTYKGFPIQVAPMLSRSLAYDSTTGTKGDVCLLAPPLNMIWGIFHEVTIERKRVQEDRKTEFYLTLEGDVNYEDEDAATACFIDVPKES